MHRSTGQGLELTDFPHDHDATHPHVNKSVSHENDSDFNCIQCKINSRLYKDLLIPIKVNSRNKSKGK